jgi:hypothetical protein
MSLGSRIVVLFLLFAAFNSPSFAEHITYQTTSDAGMTYELTIEAERPEVMKPLPFVLNIIDKNGEKISGAQINCSLTMPAMAMPSNKPPIKEVAQTGQYKGVFLLTMGGLWHAELSLSCCNGRTDTVVIPIPGVMSDSNGNEIDKKLEDLFHDKKS